MKKWILILILLFPTSGWGAEPDDSVTEVRSLINETTASFWTDAQIQNWLDQGVRDVATRGLAIQDSDTFLLVTGQYEYTDLVTDGAAGVSDIVKVWGCIYQNPDDEYIGLKRINPSQVADLPHMKAGPPVYYYHFANKIGIFPLPASGQNGDTVKVYFSRKPTGATNALRIAELPTEYKTLIYWFAAALAYKKEHRYAESDKFYQMYLQELNALKQELYNVRPEQKTP